MSTIVTVFKTLISAFNQRTLTSGQILMAGTTKRMANPRIQFKTSGWDSDWWQPPYITRYSWDIPAELVIQGPSGDPFAIQQILDDIGTIADNAYGLPVDKNGELVMDFDKRMEMSERGELFSIADRFVGPYIKRVTVKTDGDDSFSTADLMFHVEFLDDKTPGAQANAMQFTLGTMPSSPDRGGMLRDPSAPFGYPIATDEDTRSQGTFVTPHPFGNPLAPPLDTKSQGAFAEPVPIFTRFGETIDE